MALKSPERAENTKLDLHARQCFPYPKSRSFWGPAKVFLKSLSGPRWVLASVPQLGSQRGAAPPGVSDVGGFG